MGVIQRQGLKSTLLNYVGILIGALSIVFIYPQALEIYGLISFLTESGIIISGFASLATSVVLVKFFPYFKDDSKGHNGFVGSLWLVMLGGLALFSVGFWILQDAVLWLYKDKSQLDKDAIGYIPIFVLLISNLNFLQTYCTVFQRIVIVTLIDLLSKISRPILVWLWVMGWIDVDILLYVLLLCNVVFLGILLFYLQRLGQLHINFAQNLRQHPQYGAMLQYGLMGILMAMASFASIYLDRFTVPTLLNLEYNGVYSMVQFIANFITTPFIALNGIAIPIIANHYSRQETPQIADLYKKSSTVSLLAGVYLTLGIWLVINDLFLFIGKYEVIKVGLGAIFWLSICKLIDCIASISRSILELSNHYWMMLWIMIASIFVNLGLSFWLIPQYQLTGVALAMFGTYLMYGFGRMIAVFILFKMHPFTVGQAKIMISGLLVFALIWSLPLQMSPIINICIKGGLLTILYVPIVYFWRVSDDFNNLIDKVIRRIKA